MIERNAIFIAGHSRSGTTVVNNILKAHPEIAGGHQTRLFRHFFEMMQYSETRNKERGIYSFHKDTLFLYELIKKFVNEYYGAFTRRENKRFFVERTPSQELSLPLIKYCFPNAKIIYCLRDGRDVWLSHRELSRHDPAWKAAAILQDVAKTWGESVNICFDQQDFDSNQFLIVCFEEIMAEPEKCVDRILHFLDSGLAKMAAEQFLKIIKNNANVERFTEYDPGFPHKWKTHMSDSEKQVYKKISGKELIRAGYEQDLNW
ncbi:sulfotransferase [bacterium]|nr:sulfotransferase [bacterium]